MKWWGWGHEDRSFPFESRPDFWPWAIEKLGLHGISPKISKPSAPPTLPESRASSGELAELEAIVTRDRLKTDALTRAKHAYGKSFPDLWRARRGIFERAPDAVVFPKSDEEVATLLEWAARSSWVAIPFGGGTNIVGGVENRDLKRRKCLCVSLREMNQLLEIDPRSQFARFQAGILGPEVERALAPHGFTLGHFPDSFEFSSLGGWVATRSAGMQSDGYGKIENLVVSLKVVTGRGVIETPVVPTSSAGPEINRIFIGSEGTFGIITQVVVRIHRAPESTRYLSYFTRSFEDGIELIRRCHDHRTRPTMFRLQDRFETELSFKLKTPSENPIERFLHALLKRWLLRAGFNAPCLMLMVVEGSRDEVSQTVRRVKALARELRCFSLGAKVGLTWSKDKFNIPYLRDSLMDYDVIVDVAETASTWRRLPGLHAKTIMGIEARFAKDGLPGYVGCHLSHSYGTGACLYFTYAVRQTPGRELERYYDYKRFVTQLFVEQGATLSHHHAVGYEHKPWLKREIGEGGLRALRALKQEMDPDALLNPGILMSPDPHPYLDVEND